MTTRPFENRLALVTGASRGIGAETAVALAKAGAHVILTARTEGGLAEVEERIHQAGGTASIAPLDLMNGDLVDGLAQHVAGRWGKLDILVLNAGQLGPLSPLSHVPPKDWEKVIQVNLTAPYRLLRAFDLLLRQSDRARVIGLSSSVGPEPRAYWGPYAASKAGLEALLDSYADEVANISSIRVAVVNPGATRTAMRKAAFPSEDPESLKGPEVVADALVTLLTQDFETRHRLTLPKKI
ncbi:SDR family NAD(P)-dependent oxidoreductase [Pedomonas sp. V897]|mgnify:FL=1|uniref:SDR family NAD(P)-dependent oxidoreductase n=1 Tax=Pedomonas sp. V897 TaxID=3446482 RepID=UPI003EE1DFCE